MAGTHGVAPEAGQDRNGRGPPAQRVGVEPASILTGRRGPHNGKRRGGGLGHEVGGLGASAHAPIPAVTAHSRVWSSEGLRFPKALEATAPFPPERAERLRLSGGRARDLGESFEGKPAGR